MTDIMTRSCNYWSCPSVDIYFSNLYKYSDSDILIQKKIILNLNLPLSFYHS